jgi:hypothetical protein
MGTSGLLGPGGQIHLPPSQSDIERTLRDAYARWWDTATYKIVSVLSEKVLDVWAGSTENGATIRQYPYHGGTNQLWRLTRVN